MRERSVLVYTATHKCRSGCRSQPPNPTSFRTVPRGEQCILSRFRPGHPHRYMRDSAVKGPQSSEKVSLHLRPTTGTTRAHRRPAAGPRQSWRCADSGSRPRRLSKLFTGAHSDAQPRLATLTDPDGWQGSLLGGFLFWEGFGSRVGRAAGRVVWHHWWPPL